MDIHEAEEACMQEIIKKKTKQITEVAVLKQWSLRF